MPAGQLQAQALAQPQKRYQNKWYQMKWGFRLLKQPFLYVWNNETVRTLSSLDSPSVSFKDFKAGELCHSRRLCQDRRGLGLGLGESMTGTRWEVAARRQMKMWAPSWSMPRRCRPSNLRISLFRFSCHCKTINAFVSWISCRLS